MTSGAAYLLAGIEPPSRPPEPSIGNRFTILLHGPEFAGQPVRVILQGVGDAVAMVCADVETPTGWARADTATWLKAEEFISRVQVALVALAPTDATNMATEGNA